jgi:SAM-dependent methyltransferase
MDRSDPAYRGQADYSNPGFLRVYDRLVLGLFARFAWRWSTSEHVRVYREHIRPNHLDVGPGTGYFIELAGLPDGSRVTILDPNPTVLEFVTRRLRRLNVTPVQADVLKPLPTPGPFSSAALSGVIHCLPGPMAKKAPAIEHIARVLAPDGVFFGATILGRSASHTRFGRALLQAVNRRGTFDNLDDSASELREILERSFRDVRLDVAGGSATFVAKEPVAEHMP